MPKYAQIDLESGKCFAVSFLSGEISQADNLILINDMDIQDGDVYSNGVWTRNETIRIDESTVADVVYQFDLQAGEYVEQSRTERAEPLPPTLPGPEERIAQLETENSALQQRLAQMNGDFTAFQDFYFEKNPEQA